ncbi:Hypothetical predicted protein [Paramuricea clavata]|uniref:Uncharacterized protein n=1 Tax=Paramuricea clavata TaxID=317549 RepID=A0A7D9IKU1_PARCT|nr:Hypothetical predicted protein [Paramuricea clavata]
MFSFLTANNFIEHQIQKGFTPNLSGTLEHTAQMTNIINQVRIKQRSVVITLLDLKNAFGEVHHNLIQSVLDYHHIPKDVSEIIKSLYTDFDTAFMTSEFSTPFITVGRGVFQGDCLSPLIFNICINTFIQHIKADKYRQFGFITNFLNPVHWFQFADDAAVISGQDSENQHLLNRFLIWCQWSNMIVRVDKCSTFGIRKSLTKSIQHLPELLINNELIPATKLESRFDTWGNILTSTSGNQKSESKNIQYDVYTSTKEVLKTFTFGQEDKLQNYLILQGFFFSNVIKFSLSKLNGIWSKSQSNLPKNIYNFTICHINNLLPTRKNLTKWGTLSNSDCSFCLNPETLLHVVAGCQTYLPRFTWRHDSVLNFIAQTLQPVNNSNLFVDLPGCKSPSIVTGDTFRPDPLLSINSDCLYILERSVGYESNLQTNVDRKRIRYEDLITQQKKQFNPSVITGDELRPDLLITLENKYIYILELTVGFESNLLTNATRKRQKYQDLINEQLKNYKKVKFVNLSISSLGVFSHPSLDFTEMLKDLKFDEQCRKYYVRKLLTYVSGPRIIYSVSVTKNGITHN